MPFIEEHYTHKRVVFEPELILSAPSWGSWVVRAPESSRQKKSAASSIDVVDAFFQFEVVVSIEAKHSRHARWQPDIDRDPTLECLPPH